MSRPGDVAKAHYKRRRGPQGDGPTRQIFVVMPEAEYFDLVELANQERRSPAQQAGYCISQQLGRVLIRSGKEPVSLDRRSA